MIIEYENKKGKRHKTNDMKAEDGNRYIAYLKERGFKIILPN